MTEKQRKILVAVGLLSPFIMALLAVLPVSSKLFRSLEGIQNEDIATMLKAIWLCGIGTLSVFFVKRIKEAKALAAIFYVALMLPLSILSMHAYVFGFIILSCLTKTCEYL